MSNDLMDKHFKKLFKQHEMPYSEKAWKEQKTRLDQTMPASPSLLTKYMIGAAIIASVILAGTFLFNKEKAPVVKMEIEQEKVTPKKTTNPNSERTGSEHHMDSSKNKIDQPVDNITESTYNENKLPANNLSDLSEYNKEDGNKEEEETQLHMPISPLKNDVVNNESHQGEQTIDNNNDDYSITLPEIEALCQGEELEIKNENTEDLILYAPNKEIIIPKKTTVQLQLDTPGEYILSTKNGKERKRFTVHHLPDAHFYINHDIKFEKGLPIREITSDFNGENTWVINDRKFYGKQIKPTFFKKGDYTIQLTTTDYNGCSSSTIQKLHIEEDYNLMAVNSFIPNDIDPRNRTFMPFALTQRDVDFNLIIIDPKTGQIIFESSDANNPWTGINKETGKQVPAGEVYLWKVHIQNPMPGEPSEYSGQIIPIQ